MKEIKVLVVDDSYCMRKLIIKELIEFGCKIVGEAKNGKEAIKMYKKLDPDLVTMDIKMPEIDGIKAIKEIKEINPSVNIIVITGDYDSEEESLEAGAKAFLKKPFQPAFLWDRIDSLIEQDSFLKDENLDNEKEIDNIALEDIKELEVENIVIEEDGKEDELLDFDSEEDDELLDLNNEDNKEDNLLTLNNDEIEIEIEKQEQEQEIEIETEDQGIEEQEIEIEIEEQETEIEIEKQEQETEIETETENQETEIEIEIEKNEDNLLTLNDEDDIDSNDLNDELIIEIADKSIEKEFIIETTNNDINKEGSTISSDTNEIDLISSFDEDYKKEESSDKKSNDFNNDDIVIIDIKPPRAKNKDSAFPRNNKNDYEENSQKIEIPIINYEEETIEKEKDEKKFFEKMKDYLISDLKDLKKRKDD